ncbi:Trichothecene 3-O-acetyltransferase [Trichoderma ghanense]|uniref:Trichothecene 3-O-acetyltransferase n=1 Tax=Trichoderma ghanense TaxID=65468 RepID=A0ABY2GVH9_9HYPO
MKDDQESSQLSPLEWIMPRSYISQILCFPSSNPRISEVLQAGLAGTLTDVPYLASRVVPRDLPKGSVALSPPCDSLSDLFRVNDLLTTVDYNTLKSGGFRPSLFDGLDLFSPDLTPADKSLSPVFRAVLSLVKGGCLLCVSLHHSTADITAFGSLLKIWASHCRTGSSEAIQFDRSWLDRSAIVRQSHDVPADTPLLLHKEESNNTASRPSQPPKLETHFFKYSADYLKGLKVKVNKHLPEGTSWVSTSDILSAILWGSIVHSEDAAADDNVADETCFMRIAVNCRSRFDPPLPNNYLGAAFGVSLVNAKKADLIAVGTSTEHTLSLPTIANLAASVRRGVNFIDGDKMNAIIKHLTTQEDVTSLKLCQEPATRVAVVSWADEGVYELDWGTELGHCEAVRLPTWKTKRYPVVFPRLPNGDLEVLVSFDTETMGRWKAAYETSPWKAHR